MLQQFNALFTTDHHQTLYWGNMNSHCILKFIFILLSSLHLSLQNSTVPQVDCPQHYAILISPYNVCPPVWSSMISLLLSFVTRRTAESADRHISSPQISCTASSPTLKAKQHPIQWAPEVPSAMVKWLGPNAYHTLSRLGMNGVWKPLQHTHNGIKRPASPFVTTMGLHYK